MTRLLLIGIGTGNPDHLTLQACKALNTADLILLPLKGREKADLADIRRTICDAVLERDIPVAAFDLPERDPAIADYLTRVEHWHDAIATCWRAAMDEHPDARTIALLVWGDPSLYDSTLRIAARLGETGTIDLTVIPGITAMQALTAAHAIPLNALGGAFTVTTGRNLRDNGWPEGAERVVVMLDQGGAFQSLDPTGLHIWWGAYLGMANEMTLSGSLADMGAIIMDRRAAARAAHGWIMDIYLLSRTP